MAMIMIMFTQRISSIVTGTWEIFKGQEELEHTTESTIEDKRISQACEDY